MTHSAVRAALAALGLALAVSASAQIPYTPLNTNPQAANAAFALQNPLGPSGTNYQVNYPYPGQCVADPVNQALFPTLPACAGGSFSCPSQRTDGGWAACGSPISFKVAAPFVPDLTTTKFFWDVLNPPDYTPDTTTFQGADYYEIGLHEARGFQVGSPGTELEFAL